MLWRQSSKQRRKFCTTKLFFSKLHDVKTFFWVCVFFGGEENSAAIFFCCSTTVAKRGGRRREEDKQLHPHPVFAFENGHLVSPPPPLFLLLSSIFWGVGLGCNLLPSSSPFSRNHLSSFRFLQCPPLQPALDTYRVTQKGPCVQTFS